MRMFMSLQQMGRAEEGQVASPHQMSPHEWTTAISQTMKCASVNSPRSREQGLLGPVAQVLQRRDHQSRRVSVRRRIESVRDLVRCARCAGGGQGGDQYVIVGLPGLLGPATACN